MTAVVVKKKRNKIKWYRRTQDVSIDFLRQHWVKSSRTQHDKAHLSANKLAVQSLQTHCHKHDCTHALHTQSSPPVNTIDPLLSHSFPSSRLLSSALLSLYKVYMHTHMLLHKHTATSTNWLKRQWSSFRPCQSTSRHKVNTQSDWIRRAGCNIWTPIRLSESLENNHKFIRSHGSFFFYSLQTEGKPVLSRKSPTIRVRRHWLISGWHLFAMRYSFQAAETRQAPVRLNLQHEIGKEQLWVGVISRLHLFLLNTGRRAAYLQHIYYRLVVVTHTMLETLAKTCKFNACICFKFGKLDITRKCFMHKATFDHKVFICQSRQMGWRQLCDWLLLPGQLNNQPIT